MNYNFLMNAECIEGFKRYKWAKLGRTGASQASVAIDELGRLFTWGQNYWGQCGQGDPCWSAGTFTRGQFADIEFATQLTSFSDFIKSCSGETSSIALRANGELWGWGEKSPDACSAFGLSPDSGVSHTDCRGIPLGAGFEYLFYQPVLCTPGYLWKDVVHDYYHTLGIGQDNKLYSWGANLDFALGAGVAVDDNFMTPILNPYLTDDIKIIDVEQNVNIAVTTNDKVYAWGNWFWAAGNWDFNANTPTEITGLVIPVGETIIDAVVCGYGILVLLSDGTVWAAGDGALFGDIFVSYPLGTQTFERVDCLDPRTFTKIRLTAVGSFSVVLIDNNGNIWSWGDDIEDYMGNSLPYTWNIPMLCAVDLENQHVFIDAVHNTHNNVFQAIDKLGYLYTWGSQGWGPHLAIGAADSQHDADLDPYITDIVHYREFANPAEDAVLRNGDPALLNVYPVGESEYVQPLPQMLRHRPCGHWHLRLFEEEELWPRNCWMPSISIYQNHLMFVACGKHLQQGGDTGCEVIIFDYDMNANIWTLASYTNLVNAANAPGGASIYDDTMVFANWKADASGTGWYDEHYTNFGLGVWVLDRGSDYALNYTHFASKSGMYMQGKAAAYSGGIAAVAYENAAGQLLVQVSTDYGATWNLRRTVGVDANRKDWSLCIDKNGYIYLAHQVSHASIKVERSINNGVAWTVQAWANTMISNTLEIKIVADNDMLFLFASSAIESAIERSSNSGVSWFTISGEPMAAPHVSSGCNVPDDHNDIAFVTSGVDLNNYLYDTDYGGYNWLTRSISQISEEGLEINTYQGPNLADLAGYNGRFAYSSYLFYTIPVPYVAVALSVDRGVTWFVRGTPLGWYSEGEIGNFRGCPLFCLTDVPHLNHIWTFEKSNWAAEFVKQKDKYKVERPCICPQYRGT